MSLVTGTRLGPYEILAPLGEGGMGEVYRARDTRLDREVAIKVLPATVALDPDRQGRFEREARAVAALSHPNILAIFDVGVAHGVAYVVTELLNGRTLRDYMDAPLSVRKATDVGVQTARGLSAAHDKGIVHRDLKPENIFILNDGQVKILDFGLAKAIEDRSGTDETRVRTDAGTVLGTVGYMAPEQVRGEAVDPRTDLFSLGAVLYEMLAGRRAFQRDTAAETMSAILREDPPDLSSARADVPPALHAIIRHCLERNAAERFQSARDLVFSLQAVAQGSGPVSPVGSTASPPPRRVFRREIVGWVLAGLLAIGLVAMYNRSMGVPAPRALRFEVTPPEKTTFAFSLGAPEGSNGGTISPDGKTLVFVAAERMGKAQLWVRSLDSFVARPLPGTEGAGFPFWSPDSRYIAYFTIGRLKKVAVDGGPPETIVDISSTARGATWGSKGTILMATAGSPIFTVPASGGTPTAVTKPDGENSGHQWPSFLPDGTHFIFYSSGARALYVASVDGSPPKRLTNSDTNAIFAPPGQLLFMRDGSLIAQDINLSRLELIGEPRPVAQQVSWSVAPWNLGAFSASNTGVLTYRSGTGMRSQLTWIDRAGRELGTLGPPGDYLAPALSPDGTRVAVTRRDEDPAGDIWTIDVARQTMSRLTLSPATDVYPVWTPDGSSVVYESTQEGLLERAVASTLPPKRLLGLPSLLIPTQVSADGSFVLFFADVGGTTGFDIFTVPRDGTGRLTSIVQSAVADVEPQLSPNNRWLAYVSTETGGFQTFVQPFPSSGAKWQVPVNGGRQPMWSADGRELFIVTGEGRFYTIGVKADVAKGLAFGDPHFLFEMPANITSVRNSYVPTADGQRFLVNKVLAPATRTPAINVIVNWNAPVRQ
jgi:Tol biopolymer transport system component